MRGIGVIALISAAFASTVEAEPFRYCGGWLEWKAFPESVPAERSADGEAFESNSADLFFQDASEYDIVGCIESGADVDATIASEEPSGWLAPLHYTSHWGNIAATRALIDSGANPTPRSDSGETPLHFAASNNMTGIGIFLVNSGANINAVDDDGWSPLHGAAWFNSAVFARTLIRLGADIDIIDNNGNTPLDLARENNSDLTAKILANPASSQGN